MNRNKRNKRNKKKFLIYTFQIKLHQVYSNTRVTTQVNTSQHESTRVNTSLTRVNTSPTRINSSLNTSPTRAWHESTRIKTSLKRANRSLIQVKTNQRKSKPVSEFWDQNGWRQLSNKSTAFTLTNSYSSHSAVFSRIPIVNIFHISIFIRSSRPEAFHEKGVLRNFTKFTGKHLCQSLFFNKVAGLSGGTAYARKVHIFE